MGNTWTTPGRRVYIERTPERFSGYRWFWAVTERGESRHGWTWTRRGAKRAAARVVLP
jgi:hypothetical protein